jgi:LysM repeat protein
MLALLLGQSSMVRANSGDSDDSDDPMSVITQQESKVNLEEKKEEETKVEEKKDEKEDTKDEQKEEKTYTTYTVVAGDSLSLIAKKYLGNANKWRELVSLNKDKYPSLEKNPDLIKIGWVLKVPVEQKEETTVASDTKKIASDTANITPDNGKVTVTDNSTKSEDVNKSDIPNWTTEEKIKKLQECIDATNRAMFSIGFKLTDLTTESIKYMIDNGFMTQEDWMAMNPPVGYTYRINLEGKVELVDCNNIALTSDQIAKLDKELAEKRTTTSTNSSTSTTTVTKTNTNTNSKVDPTAKEVEDWLKGKTTTNTKSNTSTTTTNTSRNTVTKTDTNTNTSRNTVTKTDTNTNTSTSRNTVTKTDTKTNTCSRTSTCTATKSDTKTKTSTCTATKSDTKTKTSTCSNTNTSCTTCVATRYIYPNGIIKDVFPDGTVRTIYPNDVVKIVYPDGCIRYYEPSYQSDNGGRNSSNGSNGSNGSKVVLPDGTERHLGVLEGPDSGRDSRNRGSSTPGSLGESLGDLFKAIQDAGKEIGEAGKELGKTFSDAGKDISNDFKDIGNEFKQVGKDISDSFKQAGDDFEDGFNRGSGKKSKKHHKRKNK